MPENSKIKELNKDWCNDLRQSLNSRIVYFLAEEFSEKEIEQPTLKDVAAISWETLENSCLGLTMCKELALYQQQIRKK